MAWYRAGGGGIPSSLKTDMNDVLNKKFGTSVDYPPTDWAPTVNLMGPLPEKTVSGSIATFADGADAVPLKSLNAEIAPNLEGVDKVKVTHSKKNILPKLTAGTYSGNGITITVDSNGIATFSGTTTASGNVAIIPLDSEIEVTQDIIDNWYYHMNNSVANGSFAPTLESTEDTGTISYAPSPVNRISAIPSTALGKKINRCRIWSGNGITISGTYAPAFMVESTATYYEAPTAPDTYNIEIPNPNPNLRLTADVDDGMWTTSGTINPSAGGGFGRALTMAVSAKTTYDIYGLLDDLIVYLDSNKTMLSYERLSNTAMSLQNERKTTPANCAYIGLSALAFDVSSVSVKESFLVYGGSIDVVNGQGKSTHANVKVSDLTWTKQTASGRDFFISQVSNMKTGTPKDIDSVLPYGGEITVAAMADKSLASWTNSLRIYDTDITTVSELLEAYGNDGISYPLATPETFTFDPVPIDSKLGNNTIWSEQGDTEVTYRADINLALGGQ